MLLRRAEVYADLLRWKDLHLPFLFWRQTAADSRVVGDEPLHHRLVQRRAEHGVETAHRPGAQTPVLHTLVFLYSAAFFRLVVELLNIQSGELFQFDLTDVRRDVMLNVAAVVFHCAVLDGRFAVVLMPEPTPFLYRVLPCLGHINFPVFLNGLGQLLLALFLRFASTFL